MTFASLIAAAALGSLFWARPNFFWPVRSLFRAYAVPTREGRSVKDVVDRYEAPVRRSLADNLKRASLTWPVRHLEMIGLKKERRLEVWGSNDGRTWALIKSYPVLAASGKAGPKLKEGDEQVPEGLYAIELLNPNSRFHLSLKVSYPSAEDRARAEKENRTNLGGDIFIHGSFVSIGCLAIGDPAIEEVFVMAALAERPIAVTLSPRDFRQAAPSEKDLQDQPKWMDDRYRTISQKLNRFRARGVTE